MLESRISLLEDVSRLVLGLLERSNRNEQLVETREVKWTTYKVSES